MSYPEGLQGCQHWRCAGVNWRMLWGIWPNCGASPAAEQGLGQVVCQMLLPRSRSVVLSCFATWWLMGFCMRTGKKRFQLKIQLTALITMIQNLKCLIAFLNLSEMKFLWSRQAKQANMLRNIFLNCKLLLLPFWQFNNLRKHLERTIYKPMCIDVRCVWILSLTV